MKVHTTVYLAVAGEAGGGGLVDVELGGGFGGTAAAARLGAHRRRRHLRLWDRP